MLLVGLDVSHGGRLPGLVVTYMLLVYLDDSIGSWLPVLVVTYADCVP